METHYTRLDFSVLKYGRVRARLIPAARFLWRGRNEEEQIEILG